MRYAMRKEAKFGSSDERQQTMLNNNKYKVKDPPGQDCTQITPHPNPSKEYPYSRPGKNLSHCPLCYKMAVPRYPKRVNRAGSGMDRIRGGGTVVLTGAEGTLVKR